jgi:hypothetical protein
MPRTIKTITNFTSGQFDERLYGRDDIEQYSGGAKTLKNVIVDWYGGASRTPGTYLVGETHDSDVESRLIPFIFSREQAYALEFSDFIIRFIRDGEIGYDCADPSTLISPYADTQVKQIKYAQTADVLYTVHPDVRPKELIRKTETDWEISNFPFEKGPLLDLNTTDITITPSHSTGNNRTFTASAALFDEGHIGSIWKINDGYVEIKAFTSSTVVTGDVLYDSDIGGTSAYKIWQEGAWSDYRGFPSAIAFYEGRIVFGGTRHQPNTIWLSEPGAFEQFAGGSDDGDSISLTINARQINKIQWIEPGQSLLLGNEGGIIRVWSGSESQPLTPSNANAKPVLSEGCNSVSPITISSIPHYVQRDGTTIRAMSYSISNDNFFAGDVTALSRSLIDSEVVEMAYQQSPHSIIWAITESGRIATATIDINQKITAFSYQEDDGEYESMVCIPASGYDEVYFIVKRGDKRLIEVLMPYNETQQDEMFYVRSGLTYNGEPEKDFIGLDHLEGETVSVLADGFVQPDKIVLSGAVSIDRLARKVHIGLPYDSIIETLNINGGSALGSGASNKKNISQVIVKLYNSMGCKVGHKDNLDQIPFSKPAKLFSGNKKIVFPQGFDEDMTVKIVQDQPLPLTVTAIYPYMITNDRG